MSNTNTLPRHPTFSPILALAEQDSDFFVTRVAALSDDDFWAFVTFAEEVAEFHHHNGFPCRPQFMEIRSGHKSMQFTEWRARYEPLPFGKSEHYCRNLGTNIKEAYAKVRAAAGVHMAVYISEETLNPYLKKGQISFGKHKGTHISELDESYLLWCYSKRHESWTLKHQSFFNVLVQHVRPILDRMPGHRDEEIGEKVTATLTVTGVFKTGKGFFATDECGRKVMLKRQNPVEVEKGQVVSCTFHIKSKTTFDNGEKVTFINKWKVN